ncbi:hypothetical protein ACIBEA_15705 [Streptomyces sp. NPDC051555]|uniref:hypothetical protein n=1 Tax=Streptomyces sp. NPDC051555 TaxID=3365657 RepID=UPI0037A4E458
MDRHGHRGIAGPSVRAVQGASGIIGRLCGLSPAIAGAVLGGTDTVRTSEDSEVVLDATPLSLIPERALTTTG